MRKRRDATETILVNAVMVEPVAAATSFAFKGSMVQPTEGVVREGKGEGCWIGLGKRGRVRRPSLPKQIAAPYLISK